MKPHDYITTSKGTKIFQVPQKDYAALLRAREDAEDMAAYYKAKAETREYVPGKIAERLILGEDSPIKIWREYRGLTQQQLAKAVGISAIYLSHIETQRKKGAVGTLKKIATALKVDLDDLV